MALDKNKVTIFTDVMNTKLQNKSIALAVARGEYRGDIVQGGTVKILGSEDVVIGQYTGTITHQTMQGTDQDVAISNKPYFSIKLGYDDLSQVPKNELAHLMKEASKALAMDIDDKLVQLVTKAKVSVSGTLADVTGAFTGLATAFDLANVDEGDRGVILSPIVANSLIGELGVKLNSEKAADMAYQGSIGEYMGIEIFKSNVVTKNGTIENCIGIDMSAIVLAKSYEDVGQVEGVDFFGSALRGLMVYGIDVIETEVGLSDRIIAFGIDAA